MTLATLNSLVGLATLLLHIGLVGLIGLYFFRHRALEQLVLRLALWGGFLLAFTGLVMSLVYSEYFGLIPCGLCWMGRVFLYPQALIFGIAAWKRDVKVWVYTLWLSVIGAVLSGYQHYLQMGGGELLPCPASGVSDCARRYLFEFGYITLPLVGCTVFVTIIALMLFVRRAEKEGVAVQ